MQRRIVKKRGGLYRVRGDGEQDSLFDIRKMDKSWDTIQLKYIDFGPEDDQYKLYWDGIWLENVPRKSMAIVAIIRYAYDIVAKYAVPSELLADFDLRHGKAPRWVDTFYLSNQAARDRDIVYSPGRIERPNTRAIRLDPSNTITADVTRKRSKRRVESRVGEIGTKKKKKRKGRFQVVSRDWQDGSDPWFAEYNMFMNRSAGMKCDKLDSECVTTLRVGKAAIKAFGTPIQS
jgi:hypothetical protein